MAEILCVMGRGVNEEHGACRGTVKAEAFAAGGLEADEECRHQLRIVQNESSRLLRKFSASWPKVSITICAKWTAKQCDSAMRELLALLCTKQIVLLDRFAIHSCPHIKLKLSAAQAFGVHF